MTKWFDLLTIRDFRYIAEVSTSATSLRDSWSAFNEVAEVELPNDLKRWREFANWVDGGEVIIVRVARQHYLNSKSSE